MRNLRKHLDIETGSLDKWSELNVDHLFKFDGGSGGDMSVTGIQRKTKTTFVDDIVCTRKPMEKKTIETLN